MKREPVAIITAIVAVIEAGIALILAFGIQLTNEQIGAIFAFVAAVGGVIEILIIRPQVTPIADPRDNDGNTLRAVPSDR